MMIIHGRKTNNKRNIKLFKYIEHQNNAFEKDEKNNLVSDKEKWLLNVYEKSIRRIDKNKAIEEIKTKTKSKSSKEKCE